MIQHERAVKFSFSHRHGQVLRSGRVPGLVCSRARIERCDGPRPARVFSGAGPRDALRTWRSRETALDRRSGNHRRPRITSHGAVARPGFRIAALPTFGFIEHGRSRSFSFAFHQAARPRADAASHAGGARISGDRMDNHSEEKAEESKNDECCF